ncbi:MAG: hypothetical protein GEU90_06455 [Gemmatimonas sp.]|nr:hypothetical protein [Gemmatimonas sp.]
MHKFPLLRLLTPALLVGAFVTSQATAQTWRTMTSARQVWDTAPLEVDIDYGAGKLTMAPAESPMLYEMEIRYDEEAFRPVAEYDEDERELRLGVDSEHDRRRVRRRVRRRLDIQEGATARIGLGRDVPFDMDLKFGAGEADIELGGISLQRFDLETGASETRVSFNEPNPIVAERVSIQAGAADLRVTGLGNTRARRIEFQGGVGATVLDFSGAWQGASTASVEMGIGSVVLRLPRSHGVRLNRSSFLTSFTAPGLEQRGDGYYSANWDRTTDRLTIDVRAALGSIEIEWID